MNSAIILIPFFYKLLSKKYIHFQFYLRQPSYAMASSYLIESIGYTNDANITSTSNINKDNNNSPNTSLQSPPNPTNPMKWFANTIENLLGSVLTSNKGDLQKLEQSFVSAIGNTRHDIIDIKRKMNSGYKIVFWILVLLCICIALIIVGFVIIYLSVSRATGTYKILGDQLNSVTRQRM